MEQPSQISTQDPNNQVQSNIDKKVLDVLVKELQELKSKVSSIENKTILEELKLPEEDLKAIRHNSSRKKTN